MASNNASAVLRWSRETPDAIAAVAHGQPFSYRYLAIAIMQRSLPEARG
jgi:hypothetical protein